MARSFADALQAAAPLTEPNQEATLRARAAALAACGRGNREQRGWTSNPGNPAPERRWNVLRIRRIRTLGAVTLTVLAVVLLATPAFGVRDRLLDLIEGTPAPPAIRTHFASSDVLRAKLFAYREQAGAKMHDPFSPVIAAETRGVLAIETDEGPIFLWAAPTEDGRQCWLIQAGADATTGRPYGLGSCDVTEHTYSMLPQAWWNAERPSVKIVHVRVYDDTIARIDVEREAALVVTLPVASGHALGTVPKDARNLDLVGRNENGAEVARATVR